MNVFTLILIFTVFLARIDADSISARLTSCGTQQGCWLMPPGCEQSSGPICTGVVAWRVSPEGITFTLITYTTDLYQQNPTSRAIYGAVGFSLDSSMGDDLAFVCAINGTGKGQVYLVWNDQHEPERLYEATSAIVSKETISIVDSRMNCQFEWSFAGLKKLDQRFYSKMYNLSNPMSEFFMLFARGNADPNTLNLNAHSMADGLLFPFITMDRFSFCETGCGQQEGMPWITSMHQAQIPQNLRQKLSISHAILMLIATFILFPSAIMSVRFNKDHLQRCCASYVWFHAHWICNLLAFGCATVAFFIIYYQSFFQVFQCSNKCDQYSFDRQMHAIFGTIAYSFLCAQVLSGLCRPKVTASSRRGFNLFHTFMGYTIWILCCRSSLLGVSMFKIGLPIFFERYAEHIVWIGIYCTILCFIVCEWIVNKEKYLARDPDRVETFNNTSFQSTSEAKLIIEDDEIYSTPSCTPIIIMLFNSITGFCITTSIGIMMIRSAKISGFDV